jgi:long-chain fatty acid transport protein
MKKSWLVLLVPAIVFPSVARAGGFTFPDNGTEALGRGGAFTAKADDPTAIQYNVAGLARQRGTKLLLDLNLVLNNYDFTRSGTYPDDSTDPMTPYGGMPFPTVHNTGGPFPAPFFGITTDLGFLDRWTFAIGAYGPSSVGNRTFPAVLGSGLPSPSRYDVTGVNLLIVFPTLAAAVRATRWLDLGLALQLVYGNFNVSNISFFDLGRGKCPNTEYAPCDAGTKLTTDGVTATAMLGVMAHPIPQLSIGANVRPAIDLNTTGTVHATAPKVQQMTIDPEPASFHTHLPWELRLGVRWAFLKDNFEHGDVELDGTYEAWGQSAEGHCTRPAAVPAGAPFGCGDQVNIPQLAFFSDINPVVVHNFNDTFSIRMGGAYNLRMPHDHGVLTFRLGWYYDSSATSVKDTHLDFDTMAKYGFALGAGFKIRGIQINFAYAYVYEQDRTVTNGDIHSINGVNGFGQSSTGEPLPVINNGRYHASTQILSFGLTIAWDELLKKHRVIHYQ